MLNTYKLPRWQSSPGVPLSSRVTIIVGAKAAGVIGYVVKPIRESEDLPAIDMALSRFREFCLIESEAENLRDTLETRKVVERAKGVLMETQELKETAAFQKI